MNWFKGRSKDRKNSCRGRSKENDELIRDSAVEDPKRTNMAYFT